MRSHHLHSAKDLYTPAFAPTSEQRHMSALKKFIVSKPITWLSRSYVGNMVFTGILLGLPMFVIFAYKSYAQGILTPDRIAYIFFVCALGSIGCGMFMWLFISKPALDRKRRR